MCNNLLNSSEKGTRLTFIFKERNYNFSRLKNAMVRSFTLGPLLLFNFWYLELIIIKKQILLVIITIFLNRSYYREKNCALMENYEMSVPYPFMLSDANSMEAIL